MGYNYSLIEHGLKLLMYKLQCALLCIHGRKVEYETVLDHTLGNILNRNEKSTMLQSVLRVFTVEGEATLGLYCRFMEAARV